MEDKHHDRDCEEITSAHEKADENSSSDDEESESEGSGGPKNSNSKRKSITSSTHGGLVGLASNSTSTEVISGHEEAIVKIFSTSQSPDYECPWQSLSIDTATGSGVILPGGKILTVAHLVADHTFCQVQRCGIPDKQRARVISVSHECDLALIEPDDPEFTFGIQPMEIGELPDLRDKVYVCGFPIGGDEIGISEGVISRIELQEYNHSGRMLLSITVDAAINPGNSGGPCIKEGKIVGIAFQGLNNIDNVGEVVPTPVINHFLEGTRRSQHTGIPYAGFPSLGIAWQSLLNPAIRKSLGMVEGESGVMVRDVNYGNSSYGYLETGDVILEIEGTKIYNNGTVSVHLNPKSKHKYRTLLEILLHSKFVGEELYLKIRRKGGLVDVRFPLKSRVPLVMDSQYDVMPQYFVYCGLLFQPLTLNYLQTWRMWRRKAPRLFVHLFDTGVPTVAQQQIVVLTKILADECNMGYEEELQNTIVVSVNGTPIVDLKHLVAQVEATPDDQPTVTFITDLKFKIVLPAPKQKEAVEAKERILKTYRINYDRSEDLRKEI
jgi:S1-C subfamily serine protease